MTTPYALPAPVLLQGLQVQASGPQVTPDHRVAYFCMTQSNLSRPDHNVIGRMYTSPSKKRQRCT